MLQHNGFEVNSVVCKNRSIPKYSRAPITVFAVKDKVLAHNPIGALYLSDSYYKNKSYK